MTKVILLAALAMAISILPAQARGHKGYGLGASPHLRTGSSSRGRAKAEGGGASPQRSFGLVRGTDGNLHLEERVVNVFVAPNQTNISEQTGVPGIFIKHGTLTNVP